MYLPAPLTTTSILKGGENEQIQHIQLGSTKVSLLLVRTKGGCVYLPVIKHGN